MAASSRRTRLCLVLIGLNLAFIWGNSALPGEVSAAFSDWVASILGVGQGSQTGTGLLRKLAHFLEFASLGLLLSWLAAMKGEKGIHLISLALLGGLLTACVDESIQLLTPERASSLKDVWIDTSGVVTGVAALLVIQKIDSRRNQTMKKLISLLLVLTMALSILAGCSAAGDTAETTEPEVTGPASALEVLENIWALYGDDEKFAVIGGNMESPVDGAPGNYDMAYAENLTYNLLVPAEELANVDEAASMIHMMNANTFTGGVLHLVDGTDATAFASTMRDAILGNQWMCGFPEHLVIADMGGNYLLVSFGVSDAMGPFEAKLSEAYPDANILYSEDITV